MEKSGFSVTPRSAPWAPDYRGAVSVGKAQLYLLGWIADFGDPANFLNVHFGTYTDQFGFTNPGLFKRLAAADAQTSTEKRTAQYQQLSREVMNFLPVIPYVWAGSGMALNKSIKGLIVSPIGPVNEPFARLHY